MSLQTYQLIADGALGDLSAPGFDFNYEDYRRDLSSLALSSDRGPFTAYMNDYNGDWDVFAISVVDKNTVVSVLPDLMVIDNVLKQETVLVASYRAQVLEEVVYNGTVTSSSYSFDSFHDLSSKADALAVATAANHGWKSEDPSFLSFTTEFSAGDSYTIPLALPGAYQRITYTGIYFIDMDGAAYDANYFETIPSISGYEFDQVDAGRYLITFGNATGQRAYSWGTDWINVLTTLPTTAAGEPKTVPTQLQWQSSVPGTYTSVTYKSDGESWTANATPDLTATLDELRQFAGNLKTKLWSAAATAVTFIMEDVIIKPFIPSDLRTALNSAEGSLEMKTTLNTFQSKQFEKMNQMWSTSSTPLDVANATRALDNDVGTLKDSLRSWVAKYSHVANKVDISDAMANYRIIELHSDISMQLQLKDIVSEFHAPQGHSVVVIGAASGDRLFGGDGNDTLVGQTTSDYLFGGSGNDMLFGGYGDDVIDGGTGQDTAVFLGNYSDFTVSVGTNGTTVTQVRHGSQLDTLTAVERIHFDDKAIAFDVAAGEVGGLAYRIYQAAFNRVPDAAGLGYWIYQLDHGLSLNAMAANFIHSAEFIAQYGAAPDNVTLLKGFYQNVLHRAPDNGGFQYWIKLMDSKTLGTAEVLASFSESAENQSALATIIGDGFVFNPYYA